MQAIEFNANNKKKLLLLRKDVPKIVEKNHVLVQVSYAGICGTDLHIIQGEFPAKQDGVTLGHEFSGLIAGVGTGVTQFKVGDRVVVDPNNGCLVCDFCHSGQPHFCPTGSLHNTLGIFRNGGWANYCLVPDDQIMMVPSNITLAQAALCEPLSCLAHGWDKISPITIGKNILIIGAGIIGNLWVICLHLQGHRRVTVSEPNPHRRQQLAKLETGFDAITPDELRRREKAGIKYDFIIDCSGFGPAIENAIDLLNWGGKLYLNYDNLGIKIFALSEYESALEDLKKGTIAKAVFKL
ncbi:sorbitol dehydrogenase [Holotrichia oblita]|uniref:Sorbitol dehydrogenase n=1 Tax=Holotrichia oblita TaxID=644536 RepID=A0ACB9SKG6_HOLOL|nr:sorbitol dehydrogenase [Holotrichia oblita]